jgi:hypothetical protein
MLNNSIQNSGMSGIPSYSNRVNDLYENVQKDNKKFSDGFPANKSI